MISCRSKYESWRKSYKVSKAFSISNLQKWTVNWLSQRKDARIWLKLTCSCKRSWRLTRIKLTVSMRSLTNVSVWKSQTSASSAWFKKCNLRYWLTNLCRDSRIRRALINQLIQTLQNNGPRVLFRYKDKWNVNRLIGGTRAVLLLKMCSSTLTFRSTGATPVVPQKPM